ncbi:hypothetical protein SETIT_4G204600v2 [Setaria italica]|uniref:Uncharacterized protein n=1 Tax=Setaria italica TaxID=4555 RepID=A0A368QWF3_SETIT|nr:hypothetical protein SETIT_4G204600v2 [Setaria italica]RCV22232.1 hypothetical protein SETIT_4G204600v2 [Setaria italica]
MLLHGPGYGLYALGLCPCSRVLFLFYFSHSKLTAILHFSDSTGGNSPAIFSPRRRHGHGPRSSTGVPGGGGAAGSRGARAAFLQHRVARLWTEHCRRQRTP